MPLNCKADIVGLTNWSKPCGTCNTCFPQSKLVYPFNRDLANSEMLIDELKEYITSSTGLRCVDTDIHKNPDLLLIDKNETLIARVEGKYLEGKAFMKVRELLADPLYPKETLVVDEPKLISYFECKKVDLEKYKREIPIFIVWKYDRPCADVGGICIYQEVSVLKTVYDNKGASRKFTRRTGSGDYVAGTRLGVIDKFHYSITECKPIEQLPPEILKYINR